MDDVEGSMEVNKLINENIIWEGLKKGSQVKETLFRSQKNKVTFQKEIRKSHTRMKLVA